MSRPDAIRTRAQLFAHLDTVRRALDDAIAATPPAAWHEPADGGATRTQLLAHIEWWERRGSYVIGVLKSGGTPHRTAEGLDELNARIDRESAGRQAAEVRASEAGAWWELRTLAAALSDEELFGEAAFAWLEGESLQQMIQVESSAHWADHLKHFG